MAKKSFLDPTQKNGNLPVKVLFRDVLHHFQELHSTFIDEIRAEVQYNGLNRSIFINDDKSPIEDPAGLEPENRLPNDPNHIEFRSAIHISEPYLAFMWSLSYAVLTLYREQQNRDYLTNLRVNQAVTLFNYGLSLFERWTSWKLDLPNPQEVDEKELVFTGQVNGLFIYAACFVLCHEFGHKQLGHSFLFGLDKEDEFKRDEFSADKVAIQTLMQAGQERTEEEKHSMEIGAVISISSILFVGKNWDGGQTHPDSDERVKAVINLLTDDPNSDLWQFGVMILILWGLVNKKELIDPTGRVSVRENFRVLAEHLKDQR